MPAFKDNFPSASHALTAPAPMPQGLTRRSLLGTSLGLGLAGLPALPAQASDA